MLDMNEIEQEIEKLENSEHTHSTGEQARKPWSSRTHSPGKNKNI